MDPKAKAIISFFIPSVLFILISIPLIMKKVPRNGAYGFRTEKTLKSDDIWYEANRYGGISILAAASVSLLSCSILWVNRGGLSFDEVNTIGFGLWLGPLLVALILSLVHLKKL